MSQIGVRCHRCGKVHILRRDWSYEPKSLGGWRIRYTYTCPVATEGRREYKIYMQGELVVLESERARGAQVDAGVKDPHDEIVHEQKCN